MSINTSAAYESLFQSFGLAENPFRLSPDPRFLFLGAAYQTAISELAFGIESRRGLMVLTGEPGTGKTMVVRQLLQWLHDRKVSSAYIFHSHLNATALFEFIARDFGVRVESSRRSDFVAALSRWLEIRQLEGDSPVVVIDEAQGLSARAVSELCLLLNLENARGKLLQILLVGQPELDGTLRRPELRHLRQRIAVRCRLASLSLEETTEYVATRLLSAGCSDPRAFPTETLQVLHAYAQGVPRVINLIGEKALLAAYAERQTVVSVAHVRRAASELDFVSKPEATWLEGAQDSSSIPVPLDLSEPALAGGVLPPENITSAALSTDCAIVTAGRCAKSSVMPIASEPKVIAQSEASFVCADERGAEEPQRRKGSNASLQRYWREVAQSFTRDWRQFRASFKKQSKSAARVAPRPQLERPARQD